MSQSTPSADRDATPPPPAPAPVIVPTTPPSAPSRPAASPLTWIVALALAALVGALLFVGGYLAAGGSGRVTLSYPVASDESGTCIAPNDSFEPLCQAYDKLKSEYVDPLDDEKLAAGAIRGMFDFGVDDKYSGYMSPDEYQSALQSLSGEIVGIGAEMGVENTRNPDDEQACSPLSDLCALIVIAPLEDTPAERAGLQAGDRITAIDGQSVNGLTLTDAVGRVRGDEGTNVTLTVERDGRTFGVTMTRERIKTSEVSSRMLEDQIGYIALHTFSSASAKEFHDELAALLNAGATSIVFDLRDNPGGYIDAASDIASEFIDSGVIFIQESAGQEPKPWAAKGNGLATNATLPVVVLVNNGSASASEIVSAALQERGRATVVGQHTYGKNTVQVWDRLDNGGAVRITISRWFTPDHHSVAPDGVQPDVNVEVPDGTPPERDLILERSVELLKDRTVGGSDEAASAASVGPLAARPVLTPGRSPISYNPLGLRRAIS
jgi:carboxyl-terminal processing protease